MTVTMDEVDPLDEYMTSIEAEIKGSCINNSKTSNVNISSPSNVRPGDLTKEAAMEEEDGQELEMDDSVDPDSLKNLSAEEIIA